MLNKVELYKTQYKDDDQRLFFKYNCQNTRDRCKDEILTRQLYNEEIQWPDDQEHDKLLVDEETRLELLNTSSATTQRALLALLSHAIDGNNVDELKAARKELQDFLIER